MSTETQQTSPEPAPNQPPDAPVEPVAPRERRLALRKKIASVAVIAGLCLGVVVTRAVWEGMSALADGDAALARNELPQAISHWRRAARWYVPGTAHVSGAYERLESLARASEERGDVDMALASWRGVRGSILATRSLFTPYAHRLELANKHIADLMAGVEGGADEHRAWHYALLTRDDSPSVLWSVVAIFGFALWLGGGFLFALRGVTADDKLVPRTAAYAGIMVISGLVTWLLGLYLA